MENFNVLMDIILILAAVWMVKIAMRSIGGLVGSAISTMSIGIIILGFAHIIETMMFRYVPLSADIQEFIHRLIVLSAFILLGYGFTKIQEMSKHLKE